MSGPIPGPGIMNIKPYVGGESGDEDGRKIVKLSSNESALGPSPKAVEAIRAAAANAHRYPDGGAERLRAALAEFYDLDMNGIVCGNGSDEIISLIAAAYAGPGDEVLFSQHGFLMYPIAAMSVGATPVQAPESDYRVDVDALLAAVTAKTKIVFVANPNNPTGTYISPEEMRRLRAGLREDILLVMDCAYAEYVSRNDYTAGIEMVENSNNVIMTRTFSKIYGLAALRVGWAYCPEEIAGVFHRVRGPFNVNALAQEGAVAALHDVAHMEKARLHNDEWLPKLTQAFSDMGLEPIPSVGNFITVRFPDHDPGQVFEFLKGEGVIPRMVGGYGLTEHLRFTIGTEEENLAVIAGLKKFLAGEG